MTWARPSRKSYTFSQGNQWSTREFAPGKNGETVMFLWSLSLLIRPEWYPDFCINTCFFLIWSALGSWKSFLEAQMWIDFCQWNVVQLSKTRDDWGEVSSWNCSWDTFSKIDLKYNKSWTTMKNTQIQIHTLCWLLD